MTMLLGGFVLKKITVNTKYEALQVRRMHSSALKVKVLKRVCRQPVEKPPSRFMDNEAQGHQ